MLQSIRDRTQGWLMGVIIFLVCIGFALWGIHSYIGGNEQPDVAAKVNGYSIHQAELNTAYERLRQQQQLQLGADFVFDQKVAAQLKNQALNQLIMGRLLAQAAQREGFRVSLMEVESALLVIPAFQVDGQFSRDRFNEVLSSLLFTEKDFLASMQTTMLANQLRSGFVESAFALPSDVETAIRLVNQKRDVAYTIIPVAHFSNSAKVSDADAMAYYNQHQAQFFIPEQVSLEYLELSLPQIAAAQHFDEPQLQQFYQNNISNYTQPERWHVARIFVQAPADAGAEQINAAKTKMDAVMQRLHSGEDFAKLAQTYSDDKTSAAKGGEMDWFSPGTVEPAVEKAVALLTKSNDITAVVKTKDGFNVFKLLAVEKPQAQSFDKVRAQVIKAIAQQKAEQIFADQNDKLSNLTYANPGSLDVAVKALGLPVKTTSLFDRKGGKDAITSNPKVIAAAFSSDVLHGNNSDVIELSPDTLVVVRIKQHKAAQSQPFAAVRDNVMQLLKTQAAEQQAQAAGMQMLQQINQGKNPAQLAQQANLVWNNVPNGARFGSPAPEMLMNAAFRMPRPTASQKFTTAGFKMPNGDYAVLMLNAVHDGVVDKTADAQRRIYREQLEDSFGQLDYALYVRGLEHRAKVVVNHATEKSAS